jgi:hypothetical protein
MSILSSRFGRSAVRPAWRPRLRAVLGAGSIDQAAPAGRGDGGC